MRTYTKAHYMRSHDPYRTHTSAASRAHGVSKAERTGLGCSAESVSMPFQFGPAAADLAVFAIGEGPCAWLKTADRRAGRLMEFQIGG